MFIQKGCKEETLILWERARSFSLEVSRPLVEVPWWILDQTKNSPHSWGFNWKSELGLQLILSSSFMFFYSDFAKVWHGLTGRLRNVTGLFASIFYRGSKLIYVACWNLMTCRQMGILLMCLVFFHQRSPQVRSKIAKKIGSQERLHMDISRIGQKKGGWMIKTHSTIIHIVFLYIVTIVIPFFYLEVTRILCAGFQRPEKVTIRKGHAAKFGSTRYVFRVFILMRLHII